MPNTRQYRDPDRAAEPLENLCIAFGIHGQLGRLPRDLVAAIGQRRAITGGEVLQLMLGPPPRFGREVICLQMEDHYVRAHTALGSESILMRLSDAVSRTGGEGLEVHRSWWVAKGAIRHVSRDGRNLRLNLLNGLEVRVARRAVIRLKELDPGPG